MRKVEEPFKEKEGYIDADALFENAGFSDFDVEQAVKDASLDLSKPISNDPILLSYGTDFRGDPLCIFGEGDYSVISGVGNSRKSFLKTALVASYIGQVERWEQFKTHRRHDKIVLDIDTEQSKRSAQKTFRRVQEMVGHYPKYMPLYLRKYTPYERTEIIDYLIERYGNNIGLIAIDGYADLIKDTNDNVESAELAQRIMTWTDSYSFHITGVLHENPSGNKMRGHLGSEMSRKAATVMKVVANDDTNTSSVWHEKSRDEKFKAFEFKVNQGLPYKL